MQLISDEDAKALKAKILDSGLSVSQLVSAAWASAASFRGTDLRGGANGARIRLAPQKDWEVNKTAELDTVLPALEKIQSDFNGSASGGKKVSLADLIVLGGSAAIEKAAKDAGHDVTVPFAPGRTDASQEQTDVESFELLEPRADGFRNYLRAGEKTAGGAPAGGPGLHVEPDRTRDDGSRLAACVRLGNGQTKHGVFTDRPGTLTNDFFVNLLDMGTVWKVSESTENVYEGAIAPRASPSGPPPAPIWSSVRTRSCARSPRSTPRTMRRRSSSKDFVAAWVKVMNNDRFDLA